MKPKAIFIAVFTVHCGSNLPLIDKEGTSGDEVACTDDALEICVDRGEGRFERTIVGRQHPQCEFPVLENQVDEKICRDFEAESRSIRSDLEATNYCRSADECTITRFSSCEFGCYHFHNVFEDLSSLEARIKAYDASYGERCDAICEGIDPEDLICELGSCITRTANL